MPKLYEYFGLIIIFYANEHEPVHVHGKCQGRECRAYRTGDTAGGEIYQLNSLGVALP
jgi:hypothetical protein